jgi:hypothetical protein
VRPIVYLCLLMLLTPVLPAQEVKRGSWSQVAALTPGQRIELHPFKGNRVRGEVLSATPDGVSIELQSGQVTFDRRDVRVVKVRRGSSRFRNAAIGALIGGGIAGGVSAAALHRDNDDGMAAAITLILTMIGAGAGFAVGLIPTAYSDIYEAQRP